MTGDVAIFNLRQSGELQAWKEEAAIHKCVIALGVGGATVVFRSSWPEAPCLAQPNM